MASPDRITDDELPRRLAPGRTTMSREEVDRIQRARILAATGAVAGVGGFAALSVESITATAGMSRRTFYDYFANKDDAFLAAYDRAASILESSVEQAYADAPPAPSERAIRSILALVDVMLAEPSVTQMCIVEVLAAGPKALARRDESIRRLAGLVSRAVEADALESPPPSTTAQAVVGGIYEVIHSHLINGNVDGLRTLAPGFVYAVILPYLGEAAARAASADVLAEID